MTSFFYVQEMNEKEFKNLDYDEWHIGVVSFFCLSFLQYHLLCSIGFLYSLLSNKFVLCNCVRIVKNLFSAS